jgi:hypothetical protein
MKNKPALFTKLSDSLEALEKMKDIVTMEQVADVLGLLMGDAGLKLIAMNAKLLAADVNSLHATITANQEMDRLLGLSESQMRSWQSVNSALLNHVAQLAAATKLSESATTSNRAIVEQYRQTCGDPATRPKLAEPAQPNPRPTRPAGSGEDSYLLRIQCINRCNELPLVAQVLACVNRCPN